MNKTNPFINFPTTSSGEQELQTLVDPVQEKHEPNAATTPKDTGPRNVCSRSSSRCLLEDALECQICLDVAVSPIYSCERGHILCYICNEKLPVLKKCPTCLSQHFHISPAVERMAKKLEYKMKCTNFEAGCKEGILSTNFRQHMENCFYRIISCDMTGCNNYVFKFNEYINHLLQKHKLCPWKVGEVTLIKIPVNSNAGRTSFDSVIYDNNNKAFILRMQLTDSIFYVWTVIMGDTREAQQHLVTISLFGKHKLESQAAASWTLPVIPFHEDPVTEIEKSTPVFGSMERKIFMSMVEKESSEYLLRIKAEMIRITNPDVTK